MLLLPNGDRAEVDIRKLTGYCLNTEHPQGGPKARVFRAFLGLTVADGELLRQKLIEAARTESAEPKAADQYGERYEIKFLMQGPNGNSAEITSGWIIDKGQDFPRLTSCYIKI